MLKKQANTIYDVTLYRVYEDQKRLIQWSS